MNGSVQQDTAQTFGDWSHIMEEYVQRKCNSVAIPSIGNSRLEQYKLIYVYQGDQI